MRASTRIQLLVMMFLQYFVWGSWYVTMSTYLGTNLKFTGPQIGLAYSAFSIAAMVSPFFVGMVADRFFATERVLGVMHIIGAVLLYFTSMVREFEYFFIFLLAYTLCYLPTIALSNSLSFHQMTDPGKQFPPIRMLGTLGFIVANWVIGWLEIDAQPQFFVMGAGASLLLGIYSFFLPHVPPKKNAGPATISDVLGLDALKLLKSTSFAIFIISSMLVCVPLAFYYSFTNLFLNDVGMENVAIKMTMGQASEVLFLLVMPLFFARLGVKKMLMLGMAAWALRYLLFAFGDVGPMVWMLYTGIILHGICFDFFFVTGQIYVDKAAPANIKSAAQGMITFATYGVGMFAGSYISGEIVGLYTQTDGAQNVSYLWKEIWLVPAIASAVVLVIFTALFREKQAKDKETSVQTA